MKENKENPNIFKDFLKNYCKINNISSPKPRFESIDNQIVISIKNPLKEGLDYKCFEILNLINYIAIGTGTKFNQQINTYSNSERIDRIIISFEKEDYETLNIKLKNGDINN